MIYCVVPRPWPTSLRPAVDYYKDDPNVKVIIDRRGQGGTARRPPAITGDSAASAPRAASRDRAAAAPTAVKVVVHVDGGARGNPGPAAVAAVATAPEGDVLAERSAYIGEATNNVAEYRAVLLGLELARELGASEVEVVNDSELVARQIGGEYKVKHAGLKPLYLEAMARCAGSTAGRCAAFGASTTSAPTSW